MANRLPKRIHGRSAAAGKRSGLNVDAIDHQRILVDVAKKFMTHRRDAEIPRIPRNFFTTETQRHGGVLEIRAIPAGTIVSFHFSLENASKFELLSVSQCL